MDEPSRIRILPPPVAERIAAGEVIERPGSVVKELVENSLDAGATEIAIILEDGGKALIEVIDNGQGMSPKELELCVLRHATSKLRTLEDLDRIATLGFRGEALPSVSAVSELSLISRSTGSERAHELRVGEIGGKAQPRAEPVTFGHFLGSEHGTRIQARGLFSQVPARLKFLKSKSAEVSHVREWIERLALAHPEVGFRLISDDRPILSLKPDSESGRVKAILSDGQDFPVITAARSSTDGKIRVRVHWLQGLSLPHTRRLIQVVNGRSVRDRFLQQAILAGFKQALLPGQFPALLMLLETEPSELDVNVHPTKTEVRFLEQRRIFPAIQSLLERMIAENGAPGFTAGEADPFRPAFNSPATAAWQQSPRSLSEPTFQPSMNFYAPSGGTSQANPPEQEPTFAPAFPPNPFAGKRLIGTLFNTYLLFDLGDELGMIDQHAADERVRYERLKKRLLEKRAPQPQELLIPEAIRFPAEARSIVESRLGWLPQLGFHTELFGEDTLLFRSVPSEWGTHSLKARLKGLIERLIASDCGSSGNVANHPPDLLVDENVFEALAREACHSAVRAGDTLELAEAAELVKTLFEMDHPWNCPHGRPTVVRVPRGRFEEWFQRRV